MILSCYIKEKLLKCLYICSKTILNVNYVVTVTFEF